uniref:Uncharacterized protein MANES_15G013800 n=1 Tax=Rhizophora mucronata TaxID=61149 RepID=A0A2P2MWF9_RHIMU
MKKSVILETIIYICQVFVMQLNHLPDENLLLQTNHILFICLLVACCIFSLFDQSCSFSGYMLLKYARNRIQPSGNFREEPEHSR